MQGKIVLIFKGLFDTFSFLRKAGGVELKWTHDAEAASSQVKEKGYADARQHYAGKVILVGVNYDKKRRTMNASSKNGRLTWEKRVSIMADGYSLFLMVLFSSFDADPAFVGLDVDSDGREAGLAENGFKGFRRRVVEVIVFDVFSSGRAEVGPFVDFGDEQEGAAFFEDPADFFQVFRRIGPEVEAFDGRNLIEAVVGKGQFSTEPWQTSIFPAFMASVFV